MARVNSAAQQRSLSLTEELERLEQSITLTLQEIDQNFSVAHRIVTTSILPVVDKYALHSRSVWEGSKFWKQFFESSANVSLSGYEEGEQGSHLSNTITATEETVTEEETNTTATHTTLSVEDQSYETPSQQHINTDSIQDLDLSNLTISPSHSTPRPAGKKQQYPPQFADYPSPYEALRAEVNNTVNLDNATSFSQNNPTTPGRRGAPNLQDITHTPDSSPMLPRQFQQPASAARPSTARKQTDPLLHRILDKTYRIQATPLTSNRYRSTTTHRDTKTTTPATTTKTRHLLLDSSPASSPEVAPPQLHAEIFSSPERRRPHQSPSKHHAHGVPQPLLAHRTPGISILTPARKHHQTQPPTITRTPGVWDDENDDGFSSDEDNFDEATGLPFGASPPKTIQFHIPQSRLLKTPAKEASRQMVNDVLTAAGVGRHGGPDESNTEELLDDFEIDLDTTDYDGLGGGGAAAAADDDDQDDDDDGEDGLEPYSPSVVRRATGLDDEIF